MINTDFLLYYTKNIRENDKTRNITKTDDGETSNKAKNVFLLDERSHLLTLKEQRQKVEELQLAVLHVCLHVLTHQRPNKSKSTSYINAHTQYENIDDELAELKPL